MLSNTALLREAGGQEDVANKLYLRACHASVFLPDYAQRIRTGQYAGKENIWEARVDFDSDNGNTPEH